MGLVGSGTNNARLAGMLRNLAQFYHKEPLDLFMVRLAQVCRVGCTGSDSYGGGGLGLLCKKSSDFQYIGYHNFFSMCVQWLKVFNGSILHM